MPIKYMRTALAVLAALTIAGCQTWSPRPDFVMRSLQDCANGDQTACAMLGSLSTVPPAQGEAAADQRPRTQSEKDADAIMEGIRRARSSPPVQHLRIAPTGGNDF